MGEIIGLELRAIWLANGTENSANFIHVVCDEVEIMKKKEIKKVRKIIYHQTESRKFQSQILFLTCCKKDLSHVLFMCITFLYKNGPQKIENFCRVWIVGVLTSISIAILVGVETWKFQVCRAGE